jgi:tRNA(Ile)-lysidine synthase
MKLYPSFWNEWIERLNPWQQIWKDSEPLLMYSGGKDSTLVFALYQYLYKAFFIPKPTILHLEHGIRENSKQESSIREWLLSQEFPVIWKKKNIPKLQAKSKTNLEELSRVVRYHEATKWQKHKREYPRYIVTGHHTDDYLESVLLHWSRGGGIPAMNTLPPWDGRRFLPLMFLNQNEKSQAYKWVLDQFPIFEDESNENIQFKRNLYRKKVIPILKEGGVSSFRLYWDSREDSPEFLEFSHKKDLYFIEISKSVIQNFSSLDLKKIMNIYFKNLHLSPIRGTIIKEMLRQQNNQVNIEIETDEFVVESKKDSNLRIWKKENGYLQDPTWIPLNNKWEVKWGGVHYVPFILGESPSSTKNFKTIVIHSKEKDLNEFLRHKGIPEPVRKFLPCFEKEGKITRILASLLGTTYQDYNV